MNGLLKSGAAGLVATAPVTSVMETLFRLFAARFSSSPLKQGAVFGLGVWTVRYLGTLPILRMHRPATREPWRRNLLMISAYLVWGTLLAEVFSRTNFKNKPDQAEVGIVPPFAVEPGAVWDIVDQSSWESFPASDPPARRA